jgi:hypothetical protein
MSGKFSPMPASGSALSMTGRGSDMARKMPQFPAGTFLPPTSFWLTDGWVEIPAPQSRTVTQAYGDRERVSPRPSTKSFHGNLTPANARELLSTAAKVQAISPRAFNISHRDPAALIVRLPKPVEFNLTSEGRISVGSHEASLLAAIGLLPAEARVPVILHFSTAPHHARNSFLPNRTLTA